MTSSHGRAASPRMTWPDGRAFAFTIFDDADHQTIQNGRPVYELLAEHGLRTTKSVWPLGGTQAPRIGGATCADPEHAAWCLDLQAHGFEIGLHNVTYHASEREQTLRGLDRFRELFGRDPATLANHAGLGESIYWGRDRVTGGARAAYDVMTRGRNRGRYGGHIEGHPQFWGDACLERIRYVRNFTYPSIDTLAACPWMPYHDPDRPYVQRWFASSEAPDVESFLRLVSAENVAQLEQAGGACIVYTHLGCGFAPDGRLDPRVRAAVARLAARGGWFVPVATLLDTLRERTGADPISAADRSRLEWRWLRHKLRTRGTR